MNQVHQGRDQTAGTPKERPNPPGRRRALVIGATCLAAALIIGIVYPLVMPPVLAGDGSEYLLMLQSWFEHASPDLRPTDIEALELVIPRERPFSQGIDYWKGFVEARNSRWYSMHFWLYPLLGLPAKLIYSIAGTGEFGALQAVNVFCFILAVCFAFTQGNRERWRRLLFIALAAVGPVIWYLRWPHPEVFTWCCTLVSLTLLGRERHGPAAAAAAVGSLQNPPLILLALLPLAITAARRQGRQAVAAAAGLLPALIAPLFYLYHYGVPNLIAHVGGASVSLISPTRTLSFLADLNQGMLPYVPLLLLLGIAGSISALVRRRWEGVSLALVTACIILLIQSTPNWNSDSIGMIRYAVWITPLFAWLAAEHISFKRRSLKILLVAGLLYQTGMVATHGGKIHYLDQRSWARNVLSIFPRCYNPEPEIFVERQLGVEYPWRDILPVGYVAKHGSITKLLAHRRSVEQLEHRYGLQGKLASGMIRLRHPLDLVYLHPPRGSIRVVEPVNWGGKALRAGIRWDLVDLPGALLNPEASFRLEVVNTARYRFWGETSGARHPLTFVGHIFDDGTELSSFQVPVPLDIAPGETVHLPVRVTLPRRPGTFDIELQAALRLLVLDERRCGFRVEVLGADEQSFLARVTRNEG